MIALDRRSAVVTGGTGSLGAVVVRRLLERGAHVALPVRDLARGTALRDALEELVHAAHGPRLLVVPADPADPAAMGALVEQVMRTWGRLDILVNAAGGYAAGAAASDVVAARALWDQNVATAMTAAAACLHPMRARRHGRIVSVGALAGLRGSAGGAAYAMAKSALVRWTESLAAEVRDEGITANVVLPGAIDGPANRAARPNADPSRWATADEVASVILFLASDEASGVSGAAVPVAARA